MGLLLLNGDSGLNPRTLFSNNEQGLWLDPSQMSTLYQDSNGVTPCTAAGDPVGLILDQSRGGLSQIGADLVTNGTFAADSDWTKGANWTIGSGVATKTGGAANNLTQTIGSTAAAWYRISLDVTRSAGTLTVSLGTSGTTYAITATGSYTFFILAGSGTQTLTLAGDSSFAGTVDNVVVRNVPGNHAYQTTSASRPTLARIPSSGRRNLLTRTEEFDNAAWTKQTASVSANSITDPLGGTTADQITPTPGASAFDNRVYQNFSAVSGTTYTLSVWAKSSVVNAKMTIAFYNVSAQTFNLTSSWARYSITYTALSSYTAAFNIYAGQVDGGTGAVTSTNVIDIWGTQLETGSSATNYQKVVATTDVTESGVGDLWHLVFDGSDDSLVTNSVNFSGTAEMAVIAGVRKLSDAAIGVVVELSSNSGNFNGSFMLTACGQASAGAKYGSTLRGSALIYSDSPASYTAPITNVVSLLSDISQSTAADEQQMRINGTQVALTTVGSDAGTANWRGDVLYIGRRGGTTLPYNGHLYQLIIRGKTTPTGKLLEAERFVSKKTGVNI